MIIQTYNSAGGADYSNLGTFGSDLAASTVSDFDADLTVLLKVEEGIHDAEPIHINAFTTSGINLIISGEVPLEGSGTGNGAVYRQSHTASLHLIYDGYSLSSLQVENIEFDLVSAARDYGSPVMVDSFGNGEQLDKIITFKNCRFHSLSGGPTATCYMARIQPASAVGHAYTYTFNFENCLFHDFNDSTAQTQINRFSGRSGTVNINWKGCVAIGSATRVDPDQNYGADATLYYNKKFEGCIFTEQPTQYPGGPGNIAVSAIDCISDNSCWDLTSISNTNVSSNITVNLSGAPASDEVSFVSGSTGDFRLYDDSNNLAIGFATNSTLPSPDFEGNDRGISPFDLGAIELSIQSGGGDGGGTSEVNLVIFAGQSNMNGIGNDEGGAYLDQRSEFNAAVSGIKYWDIEASSFTDVIDPASNTQTEASAYEINFGQPPKYTDVYKTAAGNFGPELNFARLLKSNDISNTYLFKFAHNGSTLVDLSSAGDKWPQLDLARTLAVINNWNPGGYGASNQFRLYNRFKAHCEAIIDTIQSEGETLNNVTFIWAQGEQEAFTGQENNSLASGYGQACADLIDAVSGIFSGASSFYSIRTKVNVAFASGTQGDHQYYPNGFYVSDSGVSPSLVAAQVSAMDVVYDAIGTASASNGALYPGAIFPKASVGLNPGYYGNKSFSGTENLGMVRQQQSDVDTNIYGPLLDFDDLSGYLLDAGTPGVFGGRIEKLSSPVALQDISYVSAYHTPIGTGGEPWLPDTSAINDTVSKNIHYNDYALHVAGNRFFNTWANEVLAESDYTPLPDPPPPDTGGVALPLTFAYRINIYD